MLTKELWTKEPQWSVRLDLDIDLLNFNISPQYLFPENTDRKIYTKHLKHFHATKPID